ncbi:hypothetical protein [Streptomyces viridosporus]|uniref:hypothetical protein n=1 Tax=Streptomyces viridosporus TaxID=67581 RepID=UPI00210029D2|nr:hypothetical protein [Streptomyces viridosporus]
MTSAASVAFSGSSRPPRAASRRRVRTVAAAVGLAGALVLTGCSGDGGSGEDSATPAPPATATPGTGSGTGGSGTGGGTGGSDARTAPAGALEGSWLATAGGRAVALMVTGEQAALFATGGVVCSGTAREDAGTHTLRLKCTDGSEDRANGTVGSVSGSSLKVTWEGALGTETYTKAEGSRLPTGLPTAELGS